MKKVTALAVALLSIIPIQSHAATGLNVAVIDTGYDSTISKLNGHISYEVCFSRTTPSCPNGKNFQEGAGSASLTKSQLSIGDGIHGTQMLLSGLYANPNVNFVMVRASSFTSNTIGWPTDLDLYSVMSWVYANKDRLNIGAVVYSGGRNIKTDCPVDNNMTNLVNNFNKSDIPVIVAAGNNYDSHVAYPACISPIIGIGSTDKFGVALSSNYGKDLDFVANGDITVEGLPLNLSRIIGTSPAAQIFASSWVAIKQAKPTLSYAQEYDLIKKSQTLSSNKNVKDVPTLNLIGALKL